MAITSTPSLLCPADGMPLNPTADDAAIHRCPKCKSAWFAYAAVTRRLGHIAKPAPTQITALRCPEHRLPLLRTTHRKGAEIEVCPRCGGVWLNPGEFEQITRQQRPDYGAQKTAGPAAAAAATPEATAETVSAATQGWQRAEANDEPPDDGLEEAREELRDSLRNPRLWHLLMVPVFLLVVVPILFLIGGIISRETGLSPYIVVAIGAALIGAFGKKRLSLYEIEEEIRAHEAGLNFPWLARLLEKFELLLITILGLGFGPMIGGLLAPDNTELGFGGVIFMVAGIMIAMVMGVTFAVFQNQYLQDNYLVRIALDVALVLGLVSYMAQLGAPKKPELPEGETELHASIRAQDLVEFLEGLDPDDLEKRNSLGQTPLMVAVEQAASGKPVTIEILRHLLKQGARVNTPDRQGRSPLLIAVKSATWDEERQQLSQSLGPTDAIRLLLEHGAEVNAAGADGKPPIFFAVRHPELMDLLLEHGGDPNLDDGNCGSLWSMMLHEPPADIIAVAMKIPEIRAYSRPNISVAKPLLIYAYHRRPPEALSLIRYFLKRGADPNEVSHCTPQQPLHALAAGSDFTAERIEAIDLLLAAGADINQKDREYGETPLMVSGSNPEITRHLIAKGADVNAISKRYWKSVLDVVEDYKHLEAAAILREAGAKPGTEFTSPEQQKAVDEAVAHGYEKAMQNCSTGFSPCGEVISEKTVPLDIGPAQRKQFKYFALEATALFPAARGSGYRLERLVFTGSAWNVGVGDERQALHTRLGPPAEETAEGCRIYRSKRSKNTLRYCFEEDLISEVRWDFVPEWW